MTKGSKQQMPLDNLRLPYRDVELYKNAHSGIKVRENGNSRSLTCGVGMAREQSGIYVDNLRKHFFDYSLLAMYSLLFVPKPTRILVLGLGGGIVPREMSYYFPQAKIDIIEIKKEMVDVAKEFFFFEDNELINIHIGDGFNVIGELKDQYDIIMLDAFSINYVPFHLMSKEFFKMVYDRTKEDGVVIVNASSCHPSFYCQLNTIMSVFGENLYGLIGERNNLTFMTYVLKNDKKPMKILNLPTEYYPQKTPFKIEITDEIKNAKIFEMK